MPADDTLKSPAHTETPVGGVVMQTAVGTPFLVQMCGYRTGPHSPAATTGAFEQSCNAGEEGGGECGRSGGRIGREDDVGLAGGDSGGGNSEGLGGGETGGCRHIAQYVVVERYTSKHMTRVGKAGPGHAPALGNVNVILPHAETPAGTVAKQTAVGTPSRTQTLG